MGTVKLPKRQIIKGALDSPLLLCYYYIMKKFKDGDRAITTILQKVRSKTNSDIYYTYRHWEPNEIDGITFIPVVKELPDPKKNQVVHYMRKDNMEYVK